MTFIVVAAIFNFVSYCVCDARLSRSAINTIQLMQVLT